VYETLEIVFERQRECGAWKRKEPTPTFGELTVKDFGHSESFCPSIQR
jgi:hypothetical protein